MTFSLLVDQRAAENPDGSAVADSTTSLTNAELLTRVEAVAAQIADLGIASGDVVALPKSAVGKLDKRSLSGGLTRSVEPL